MFQRCGGHTRVRLFMHALTASCCLSSDSATRSTSPARDCTSDGTACRRFSRHPPTRLHTNCSHLALHLVFHCANVLLLHVLHFFRGYYNGLGSKLVVTGITLNPVRLHRQKSTHLIQNANKVKIALHICGQRPQLLQKVLQKRAAHLC